MNSDFQSSLAGAAITAFVGGVIAAVAEWVRRRRRPRVEQADVAQSISNAFQRLVDQLQDENARHLAQIKDLRGDAARMQSQLGRLKAFAAKLFKHVDALEAQVRELGATPIPRPELPPELTAS